MYKVLFKYSLLIVFALLAAKQSNGQLEAERQAVVDSIKNILNTSVQSDSTKAKLHSELGYLYRHRLIDSCIGHLVKSVALYKKLGDSVKMYRQLLSTVEQYYIKGDLFQSLRIAYQVESYCLNENYTPYLGEVYNIIGNNLKRQGDWNTAISFYDKSRLYAQNDGKLDVISWGNSNIAECYLNLKEYDTALIYSKRALTLMKKYVKPYYGYTLSYYALILHGLGRTDSVSYYLHQGLRTSINSLGYFHRLIPEQLNHLSYYFTIESETDSVIKYARKAFTLSNAIPVPIEKEEGSRNLAKAFEVKGNIDSALFYQKVVSDIGYQLDKQRDLNELKHLNTKVQELKNKALIESEQAQRKRWGLVAISSIIVLALTILLLFNIKKQNRLKSQAQEAKLLLLKKENETKDHILNNTMMELVKSNNGFSKLMQNIDQLSTEMNPIAKKKARSILLEYKGNLQEDSWRKFNLEFENANANFYNVLKKAATGITESELRIAAMHVSGLSNKEIASVTGQALRSIHTHKSNLRKKLEVADDAELTNILENLQEI